VDPLSLHQQEGANPYAAKPAGNGLGLFLALGITLSGPVDPDTGFILNVCDIDSRVRHMIVPVFNDRICNRFGRRRPVDVHVLLELLSITGRLLRHAFETAHLDVLSLKLTPYRCLTMRLEEEPMAYFSEKFEFAAMHKLWNDRFSEAKNFELFGKCANPAGHGHNYVVEVTVRVSRAEDLDMCALEEIVHTHLIDRLDHRSLNADVPYFKEMIPTMENIAKFAWETLAPRCAPLELDEVTIWESDRTRCTYRGSQD
jgi:6-pyruvoyltetrahydropterin/6-carboxytetrahydropterin synthase